MVFAPCHSFMPPVPLACSEAPLGQWFTQGPDKRKRSPRRLDRKRGAFDLRILAQWLHSAMRGGGNPPPARHCQESAGSSYFGKTGAGAGSSVPAAIGVGIAANCRASPSAWPSVASRAAVAVGITG